MKKMEIGIIALVVLWISIGAASATVVSHVTFQDTGLNQTSNTTVLKQLNVYVIDDTNTSNFINISLPPMLTYDSVDSVSYRNATGPQTDCTIVASGVWVNISLDSGPTNVTSVIYVALNVSTVASGTGDVDIDLTSVSTAQSLLVHEYPVVIDNLTALTAEAFNTSSYIKLNLTGNPLSTYNLTAITGIGFYPDDGGAPNLSAPIVTAISGQDFYVLSTISATTDVTATSQTDPLDNDSITVTFTGSGAGGSISGLVKDTIGNGIPGIEVQLWLSDVGGNYIAYIQSVTSISNPNGSFVFSPLNPGNYMVKANTTNFVGIAAGPIWVNPDYQTTGGADIVLTPIQTPTNISVWVVSQGQELATIPADGISTVHVIVNVKDQHGIDMQGANVNLALAPGHGLLNPASVTTDINGMAAYATVTSTLNVLGEDIITGTLTSGSAASDNATIRYIATTGDASISGIVTDQKGDPIPFAKVWISSIGGNQTYEYAVETAPWTTDVTLTNEHGQYALYDVYATNENTNDLLSGNNYSFYNLSAYKVEISTLEFYNKTVLENRVIEDNVTNTYNIILVNTTTMSEYTIDLVAPHPPTPSIGIAGGDPVPLTATVETTEYVIVDSVRYDISHTPESGALVNFVTDNGTLSVSAAVTNSNGIADVTIQSDTIALATINASFSNVFDIELVDFVGIGQISGDITNEDNIQLAGASVELFKLDIVSGQYDIAATDVNGDDIHIISGSDTPDGHYAYVNVPTGTYKVIATYDGSTGFADNIGVISGTETADVVISGAVVITPPEAASITSVTITPTVPTAGIEMNLTIQINNPGASFTGRVEGNIWSPSGVGKYLGWEDVVIPSGVSTVTIIGPAGGESSSYITREAGTHLYDVFLENVDNGEVYSNATDSKLGVSFTVDPAASVYMSSISLTESPTVGSEMTLSVNILNPTASAFTGTMNTNIWDSVQGYALTSQTISIAAGGSETLTFNYTPANTGIHSYDLFMVSDVSGDNDKAPWDFVCMDYSAGVGFTVE